MTPTIMKLQPTIYVEAIPELVAERARLDEECAERSRETRRRIAAGVAFTTVAAGLLALA